MDAPRPKRQQGFAVIPPEQQRAIASRGGKAAHRRGAAYEWTSDTAREAGRKGGRVTAARRAARQAEERDA